MKTVHTALAAALLLAAGAPAGAAVIDGDDIGGLSTFVDTSTGYTWLDLDNFVGQTIDQMIAAAGAAGFTLADRTKVETLLGSLPLDAGQWAEYQPIIGDSPSRDLYWAAYKDSVSVASYGYAFAYGDETVWKVYDDMLGGDVVPAGLDLNIFAYRTVDVPEPAALGLLALGVLGIAASRRHRA